MTLAMTLCGNLMFATIAGMTAHSSSRDLAGALGISIYASLSYRWGPCSWTLRPPLAPQWQEPWPWAESSAAS